MPRRKAAALMAMLLAGAAHADSACHYAEIASLKISYLQWQASPALQGAINGNPVNMLLDTGADATYLMRADVEKLGMTPARTRAQAYGVGGNVSIFSVKVKDFAIGDAHVKNLSFPVLDALDHSSLAGIIGDDFLMQYDVELDLGAQQMKLFKADHCADKGLAYWNPDAQSVPMQFAPGTNRPLVQVQINGTPVWALVDTGAARSSLDMDAARRLGFSTDAPGVTEAGGAVGVGGDKRATWHMTFDSFTIGDEVIQHPRLSVIDRGGNFAGRKPYEMLLGHDFLRTHHVLLATSQMQLYFAYNSGQVFSGEDTPRAASGPGHDE